MAFVADSIDNLSGLCSYGGSKLGKSFMKSMGMGFKIKAAYVVLVSLWIVTLGKFSDSDFSVVMTGGSIAQLLGFLIVAVQIHSTKSVEGLSSQSMAMFALFYFVRLCSTALRDGYIPVDSSGDWIMQTIDFGALLCVCHILFCIHKTYLSTYQAEHDTMPVLPMIVPCFVLGYFVHGDFNKDQLFDFIWATSLNLETLTLVPQLWMMAKIGGRVDTATAHYVACLFGATVCRFTFWWWAHVEQNSVTARYHIIICHILQLVGCADFMFYYVQAWINGTSVDLPASGLVI